MPIGVPRVPYRLPGEPTAQWVDIYNRLYRERILFLGQVIDDELANQLIGIMLYLNSEDESKELYMYINSPGGYVNAGLAIYDTMQHIQANVTTICVGCASSMASFVLVGGTLGQRIALQHARIMIHQPLGGSQGQASNVKLEALEVLRLRQQVGRLYAKRTGQSLAVVARDMDRDRYLSAADARQYGLIDNVVQQENEQVVYNSMN
jgi:ATP-dependent Clp protease protease subunit|uniref:ATP-dependent Clp protease proteolytic subunit n=1 Tax=Prasinoderma coloniale TaxID=156133 RepID=A0A088CI91_9VIRI|nr:proteolytic subunit 2 of clp protease [Prasinoderma coloniale]AID67513.1 proteolytic subunit 2 of clp protease [Prasinoderma coloniale]|tara:strand:+ start:21616 stop:22236 length:621 start_codon:yes stop_codon:yes gene_type:complete